MKVKCIDDKLHRGERLLGIKEWEEYDVEDTVESTVCWQKYVIYMINWRPFEKIRFVESVDFSFNS